MRSGRTGSPQGIREWGRRRRSAARPRPVLVGKDVVVVALIGVVWAIVVLLTAQLLPDLMTPIGETSTEMEG